MYFLKWLPILKHPHFHSSKALTHVDPFCVVKKLSGHFLLRSLSWRDKFSTEVYFSYKSSRQCSFGHLILTISQAQMARWCKVHLPIHTSVWENHLKVAGPVSLAPHPLPTLPLHTSTHWYCSHFIYGTSSSSWQFTDLSHRHEILTSPRKHSSGG